jgi:hypothetical protein
MSISLASRVPSSERIVSYLLTNVKKRSSEHDADFSVLSQNVGGHKLASGTMGRCNHGAYNHKFYTVP